MHAKPNRFVAAVALLSWIGAAAGCFNRPTPECAFLCGAAGECPEGYACAADGWCKRSDVPPEFLCASAAADASVADAEVADAAPDAEVPGPAVTLVAPESGPLAGDTAITITGTGFEAGGAGDPTVTVGGVPAEDVVVVSDTEISARTPAGADPGPVAVVVENANGTANLPDGFRYHAPPTVTAIDPTSGDRDGGEPVTITGTGFMVDNPGLNTVRIGDNEATGVVVISDTTIEAVTPAGQPGPARAVVVTNDNGSATLPAAFTFQN